MDDEEDHEHSNELSLECPFLTDSRTFARGVEFGMLVEQMAHTNEIVGVFRLTNQEQILLLANRRKWKVEEMQRVKEVPGWFGLKMSKL